MLNGTLKDPQCARRAPRSNFRRAARRGAANIQHGKTGALKETRPKSEHKRARRRGQKHSISLTQQRAALSGANA
eukprot:840734-Pyramimonas_sp.AAC.1